MNWKRIAADRQTARCMLGLAVVTVAVFAFLWMAAPPGPSPMFVTEAQLIGVPASELTLAIGMFGVAVGLLWMWRIYRGPTKSESGRWRYRDR